MLIRRVRIVVAALSVVATACGGGSGDAQAMSDAIAEALMEDATADSPFSEADAQCFGDEIVDRMGVDRLEAVGLGLDDIAGGADPSSVDLDDGDVDDMVDSMQACIDFGQVVVDAMGADLPISEGSATCLADGINEADFVRQFAASSLLEDDLDPAVESEMSATLLRLLGECLTDEELGSLGG